MALTYSEATLGTQAPSFDLPTANPWIDEQTGSHRALTDYSASPVLIVAFICNHCPYVVHVRDALVQLAQDYAAKGVQWVAISPNDTVAYPEDSFEKMTEYARRFAYPFPYLFDETQAVAKAYGAVCTPDLFVYDATRTLVYRGRLDATRPGRGTANGEDLRAALDELLATGTITGPQYPSMGCSIKWKT